MRTTVVPSVAKALSLNARNKNEGRGAVRAVPMCTQTTGRTACRRRTKVLCIGVLGDRFLWLKGVLQALFGRFGAAMPAFEQGGGAQYHPGRRALITESGRVVGEMGELHPDVLANLDIPKRAVILEIELGVLLKNARTKITYQPLPRYPAVVRGHGGAGAKGRSGWPDDGRDQNNGRGRSWKTWRCSTCTRASRCRMDTRASRCRLRLRDVNKTLRDEEVNALFARVVQALADQYGAKLRGN